MARRLDGPDPSVPQPNSMIDTADQLEALEGADLESRRKSLARAHASLETSARLQRKPSDESAITRIAEQLHQQLLTGRATKDGEERHICEIALEIFGVLSRDFGHALRDEILTVLVPYTDPEATWTTPSCTALASKVLDHQLADEAKKADFIVEALLGRQIRPELSKIRPGRLTPAGRKAEYEESDIRVAGLASRETPLPWKGKGAHLISTFRWAIEESNSTLIGSNWPLFMPFLLGLLEDTTTDDRVHGLRMANSFIQRCPPHILRDRGIGMLLQDTMLPTLQFLPSITPEHESVRLLGAAYPALIQLSQSQFNQAQHLPGRRRLLDRLLREGIFLAFTHASEHVNIMQLLSSQTAVIVNELGIHAVKHLNVIIPTCSAILSDPFLASQTPCLMAALDEMQATLLCCWPRVSANYMNDIIKAISLCWLNIADFKPEKPTQAMTDLEQRLREVSRLASELVGDKDPRVAQALGPLLIQPPIVAE